jgi:hypothetical protein
MMCDICGRKFKARKDVWMHKLSKHEVLAPECDLPVFSCPECSKRFLREDFFNKHVNTHNRVGRVYACGSCDYSATAKRTLKYHEKRVHGDGRKEDGDGEDSSAGEEGEKLGFVGDASDSAGLATPSLPAFDATVAP